MNPQILWDHTAALPAGLYAVAANETWLEEQAREGYHALGTQGRRICFAKGESKNVRYRMQPMGREKDVPDGERIDLYRSFGWEYVGSIADAFHLWRCEDSSAPEPDTDPIVQADGYRYLKKRMLRSAAVEGALVLVLILLCGSIFAGGGRMLCSVLRNALPFEVLFRLLAILLLLAWEFSGVRTMMRALKQLEGGEKLLRPCPYRRRQLLQRVGTACCIGSFLLQTLVVLWPAGNREIRGWSAMAADRTPQAGTVYLDLRYLAEREQELRFETALQKFHELAPSVTQVRMRASEGGVGISAETTHYVLRHEALTSVLTEDIRYAYRNWEPFAEMAVPGLDRCLISMDDGPQVLIAAKGNEVLEIVYGGKTDLRTQGAYLASLLG